MTDDEIRQKIMEALSVRFDRGQRTSVNVSTIYDETGLDDEEAYYNHLEYLDKNGLIRAERMWGVISSASITHEGFNIIGRPIPRNVDIAEADFDKLPLAVKAEIENSGLAPEDKERAYGLVIDLFGNPSLAPLIRNAIRKIINSD
jgi:hypothetical protein